MQYVPVLAVNETVVFCQSAEPLDLQAKVAAAIASLPNFALSSFYLGGGGSGHTFIARVGLVQLGGVANAVAFYMAADAVELAKARAKVVAGLPMPDALIIVDEPIAGASKGTRFMGAIVYDEP